LVAIYRFVEVQLDRGHRAQVASKDEHAYIDDPFPPGRKIVSSASITNSMYTHLLRSTPIAHRLLPSFHRFEGPFIEISNSHF
jgi:hypothetical protein